MKLSNSLNSFKHSVNEHFFKKLKNKEQDIFACESDACRMDIDFKSNCCLIFENVSFSEGARTVFDFPVVLELVQLLVGL